jgi:hypothetical protein
MTETNIVTEENLVPKVTAFAQCLKSAGLSECLRTFDTLETLQINITRRCNLSCKHCHVSGSPNRNESLSHDDLQAALDVLKRDNFTVVDITGGAPELHPDYEWFLSSAAKIMAAKNAKQSVGAKPISLKPAKVITRTNLAILANPNYAHLPKFWAELGVEVVASLPHYEMRNTDRQRGDGVFAQAILGLTALNNVGYGIQNGSKNRTGNCTDNGVDSGINSGTNNDMTNCTESKRNDITSKDGRKLVLNLVANPGGAILPPSQTSAEIEFKARLQERYGVSFNNLLTITNNPSGRFREFLQSRDLLQGYLDKLCAAFNPAAVPGIMCRSQINVSPNGTLYDCDFNEAASLPLLRTCTGSDYGESADTNASTGFGVGAGANASAGASTACTSDACALTIKDLAIGGISLIAPRNIRVGDHCYACTAGAGSSCGGTTA